MNRGKLNRGWRYIASLIFLFSLITPLGTGSAQEPEGAVYVVQEGDTLWDIAIRFGVKPEELQSENKITDPGQIRVGDRLLIPGLKGMQGEVTTQSVPYGETLRSLSRRYQIDQAVLARLNRLSNPLEIFAGVNLVLPVQDETLPEGKRISLAAGQSLLESAMLNKVNPWSMVQFNSLPGTWSWLPGDYLRSPGVQDRGPGGLPPEIQALSLEPTGLLQGKTNVVRVNTTETMELSGVLMDHQLHFYPDNGDGYVALQGIHAMTEPGIYPLEIRGKTADGESFSFAQMVMVKSVDYPFDLPLTVNPATVDPAVTRPEDEEWAALTAPSTPERHWLGVFQMPSPLPVDYCLESNECWTSRFGNRRSYNGSPYNYFHTGLDIAGGAGTEIYAPAGGVVVFAGPLTVRGNATVIDHGQGVYSAYMHQSEIFVQPGDKVQTGQLIGKVGGTGRAQGPHLHWEVWVNGVQVDPLDWLRQSYP